ncbi:MAG: VTT domain-containing protein [Acidobacteriota bacterium]
MTLRERVRGFLPLLPIIIPIVVVAFLATRLEEFPAVRAAVETMRAGAGEWWAVPLFVLLYAVFTIFILPLGLFSAAGALIWGWKVGGAIELVTCTLSAIPPFMLARRGLAGWVERRMPRKNVPVLDSVFALFLLRLVPIVPYVALNYLAGATTRVRMRDYVATTLAGTLPSVFLFAWFVDTMAGAAIGVVTEMKIAAACTAVAAVAILVRFTAKRIARRA